MLEFLIFVKFCDSRFTNIGAQIQKTPQKNMLLYSAKLHTTRWRYSIEFVSRIFERNRIIKKGGTRVNHRPRDATRVHERNFEEN